MTIDATICESVADADTTDWACPTCDYINVAPFLFGECARCGFQIDPDMFEDAFAARAEGLAMMEDIDP